MIPFPTDNIERFQRILGLTIHDVRSLLLESIIDKFTDTCRAKIYSPMKTPPDRCVSMPDHSYSCYTYYVTLVQYSGTVRFSTVHMYSVVKVVNVNGYCTVPNWTVLRDTYHAPLLLLVISRYGVMCRSLRYTCALLRHQVRLCEGMTVLVRSFNES